MKKEEAFARKRKVRDKANLRWIKSRHWVTPGFIALAFTGSVSGGTIARDFGADAQLAAATAGMFIAIVVGGPYIVRRLCK